MAPHFRETRAHLLISYIESVPTCSFPWSTGGCRLTPWITMRIPRIRLVSGWGMRFETSDTVSRARKVLSGLFFLMACSADAQVRAPEKSVTVHVVVSQARATKDSKTATSNAQDASHVVVWFSPLGRPAPAAP